MAKHGTEKHCLAEYDSSNTELIGVNHHTLVQTGAILPVDYAR